MSVIEEIAAAVMNFSERDLETLAEIEAASKQMIEAYDGWRAHTETDSLYASGFVKPMHFGGRDASHHSRTAKKLVRGGYVEIANPSERRPGCSKYWKAGCFYRVTEKGRAILKAYK